MLTLVPVLANQCVLTSELNALSLALLYTVRLLFSGLMLTFIPDFLFPCLLLFLSSLFTHLITEDPSLFLSLRQAWYQWRVSLSWWTPPS